MPKNQIPAVLEGTVELESGSTINIGSPLWWDWLQKTTSFRFVPSSEAAPFTARKEKDTKGEIYYWYAYRKHLGKLYKRYIGRLEDLSIVRLEEVAQELNDLSPPTQTKVKEKKSPTKTVKVSKPALSQGEEIAQLKQQVMELHKQLELVLGKLPA